ncbi:MAG: 4a-hydroxytetrahydrobiopterin dehydratase [Candidatus Adlerbacteria bacterium]|nr:4a-hydroxytetrahydrobiopterin dehydratase [Candidatus Adlerbacteria bacterium]
MEHTTIQSQTPTPENNSPLTQQKCMACEGGVIPFSKIEADILCKQIPGWDISLDAKSIAKRYGFKDFNEALVFVNKVGVLAESEGHHPDIYLKDYKFVELTLSTHAINGLSQNDFILAAKIDA